MAQVADKAITATKNILSTRTMVLADDFGAGIHVNSKVENTHALENRVRSRFSVSDGVDAGKGNEKKQLAKEDLDDLRKKWNVPEKDTIAVGKTDVPGLEDIIFEGGSPAVRKEAGLPDLDTAMPDRPIKSPGKIASATRHAEEVILNEFIKNIEELGKKPEEITGILNIHQSNVKGVCPTCIQGLNNPSVPPGIFKQFSEMFPNITIKVTSETAENVRPNGRLEFVVKNGKYID